MLCIILSDEEQINFKVKIKEEEKKKTSSSILQGKISAQFWEGFSIKENALEDSVSFL